MSPVRAVHDPIALVEARRWVEVHLANQPAALARVSYAPAQMDALQGADALVIVTEWKAFRSPDFTAIKATLKQSVVFDGRHLFEPAAMKQAGIAYVAIGRTAPAEQAA